MPRPQYDWQLAGGKTLKLGPRTLVMGILNVTPDSFSDGGVHFDADAAIRAAEAMVEAGADILDVGGESTRPGAEPLPADEEWRRVGPVIDAIASRLRVPVSIDTYKAEIAGRALDSGAVIVNDVSAFAYDERIAEVAARRKAGVILMHTRGRSASMYALAVYADVVGEIAAELSARAGAAMAAGVAREGIVLDPGFGFAKQAAHSIEILARFGELHTLGFPLLSGPSRKSFLQTGLGERPPAGRIWGTAAAVAASVLAGAHIVRVHDVKEMVDVVRVADAIAAAS
ncbi:MAG TPA: dihydropteroate synthase [Vicinamibacterales bacterium]|nr:dihydropteroate synthase [Vicinamibacterales bacterium]